MSRVHFAEPGAVLATDDSDRSAQVPIRVWARSLDEATIRQLRDIASQPYVVLHVAAMADAHVAEGVAVGTVFATENTVVPAALGGDLGCGMLALRLDVCADARGNGRAASRYARRRKSLP
jgi:tRNA-splicing ligase RtcB (3'-phosphate/5'-hydroxy nucleic acid ligase)